MVDTHRKQDKAAKDEWHDKTQNLVYLNMEPSAPSSTIGRLTRVLRLKCRSAPAARILSSRSSQRESATRARSPPSPATVTYRKQRASGGERSEFSVTKRRTQFCFVQSREGRDAVRVRSTDGGERSTSEPRLRTGGQDDGLILATSLQQGLLLDSKVYRSSPLRSVRLLSDVGVVHERDGW